MEIDESKLIKNAILKTLEYLKSHEPKCICEQCNFGYKYDEESKIECEKYKQRIIKEHKIWEEKILYWEEQIKNNAKF